MHQTKVRGNADEWLVCSVIETVDSEIGNADNGWLVCAESR